MKEKKLIGYVGTYTNGDSEGIYSFQLAANEITDVKVAAALENPTYITISADNQFLYSVIKKGEDGGIASYKINENSGELHAISTQLSAGSPPCHVTLDDRAESVLSANYHKGTIDYYSSKGGIVEPALSTVEHHGSGPHTRQEKPHTHYAGFTPDEKYTIAVDLGIDQIIVYELIHNQLIEKSVLNTAPGSGPRHLVFHPNGQWAYVMTELSSEVISLKYDKDNGRFTQIQAISSIPTDFSENNQGSAIHISSDGRFIYAGNRGHDSIALFAVDQQTGLLSFIEHTSTYGNWPRDFVLDPSENYLVASNQNSSSLTLYRRNCETGKLSVIQKDVKVPNPVCVKFLNLL